MHAEIYKFFDSINNIYDPIQLKPQHDIGEPVPYTIIDDFLPQRIFDTIVNEIDKISPNYWNIYANDTSNRSEARNFVTAPNIQTMSNSMQGASFLKWIEALTGIKKLIADPYLRGGGVTKVFNQHAIGLHTDFNWNEQLRLTRRVNLIIYLSPLWQDSWGGDLELWDFDNTKCVVKISPNPNRLVMWNYDERLIHGAPHPLSCPDGIARQNLIQFYYNSNATHDTMHISPHKSIFYY